MRFFSFLLFTSVLFMCFESFAQMDTIKITSFRRDTIKINSIEEAINNTLIEFRANTNNSSSKIYNIVEFELNLNNIDFTNDDYIVENGINPKRISSKENNFVFKYVVSNREERTFITVIQWRLKKKSNKKMELINLMSGRMYELVKAKLEIW